MISAIQKAYQPCEMPEIFITIQRHGTSKISWRMAALIMLMIPFPSPEEKYPQRIVMADITKEMEIILSAGMPSSSISELAENSCSSCSGKHQNMTVPHKAMLAPVGSKTFHVCCTRSSLSKSIDWHHQEILQLIVDTKKGNCCCGNIKENAVYYKCHNASDCLHNDCGKSHPVDIPNVLPLEMIVLQTDVDDWISETVKQ